MTPESARRTQEALDASIVDQIQAPEANTNATQAEVRSSVQLGLLPERGERELAQAAWDAAERALQRANAFDVADLYASTLAARRRAMAAGIDVMSQLRG